MTRSRSVWAIALLFAVLLPLESQVSGSLEYDSDLTPVSVFKARRDSVMRAFGEEAIVVLYASPVRVRNNDVDYLYRQDDYLFYLTGFTEPNAVLVLVPKGMSVQDPADTSKMKTVKELFFVQERNQLRERWEGRIYGPDGAMKLRGLEYATTNDKVERMLPRAIFGGARYVYVPPFRADLTGELAEVVGPIRSMLERFGSRIEMRDPTPTIARMRAVKDADEVRLLRKATEISAKAHVEAMRSVEPEMYEYEIQAVYEHVFTRLGAQFPGYPSIVGSGENTCILHYNTNRKQIRDGDLVLADCAAEYHGYSSDVTRTYPANGKFSKPQRQIYDIVLAAQEAAIAVMKPGARWGDAGNAAAQAVEEGLFNLGLIKEKNGREYRKFYWHGLGHPVGLNVHDIDSPVLQPGVLYTVEPGIYIPAGTEGVDPMYFNIGVRIEDVILVTPSGNENLSSYAPRKAEDIEKLMRAKGIGNQKL